MEIKLLKTLDQTNIITISTLAKLLNLSIINTLNLIGKTNTLQHNLISCQNGKYRLTNKLNFLKKELIQQHLLQNHLTYDCIILDHCSSTNNYAMTHIEQLADRSIVSCEWQSAGKGRFGRTWLSSIAHDITVSIVYHLPIDFKLSLLPIISAVAINRLLKNNRIINKIKWPNDIYHSEIKIAGILVDNVLRNNINHIIIGIGIDNIINLERNQFIADLIINLEQVLNEFKLFGFAILRREWLDNCWHLNKNVSILQNKVVMANGNHCDITEDGALVVQTHNGTQIFSSSAISLIVN